MGDIRVPGEALCLLWRRADGRLTGVKTTVCGDQQARLDWHGRCYKCQRLRDLQNFLGQEVGPSGKLPNTWVRAGGSRRLEPRARGPAETRGVTNGAAVRGA